LFAVEVSHYTQYFGIASYASKIALNRLDASHVLVSYTSDVELWDGVDTLMVGSGVLLPLTSCVVASVRLGWTQEAI
jgi:hypothetical protein